MPFVDTNSLDVIERLPGWRGRYFHSPSMTFAHYEFKRESSIHEHFHPQESGLVARGRRVDTALLVKGRWGPEPIQF